MSAKNKTKSGGWLVALCVFLALAVLVWALVRDSANRLTQTEYTLECENLPRSFDGFRIVQLSDLHLAQFGEENEKLLRLTAAQEPDIIALTGDFLQSGDLRVEGQAKSLEPLFAALSEIAPCYFVSGNHDWASGDIEELVAALETMGVKYLRNEYVTLEREGKSIVLAGVEDPNGYANQLKPEGLVDIIYSEQPDSFRILLAHRNYWATEYPDLQVDIILCGHAHGGIVRLPFLGGVLGNEGELFPGYEDGAHRVGRYEMVVSRGLGNSVMPPRFLNNPEIVTVVLRAK